MKLAVHQPIHIENGTREDLKGIGIIINDDDVPDILISPDVSGLLAIPEKWCYKASSISYMCYIYDGSGRRRIEHDIRIYHGEWTHTIRLLPRYQISRWYPCESDGVSSPENYTHYGTVILDTDQVSHITGIRDVSNIEDFLGSWRSHIAEAIKYLNENYPEWRNPLSYWD